MAVLFAVMALVFTLVSLSVAVAIANELRSRGMDAKPELVRWMVFKYMAEYRRVTLEEAGQVGPLYNRCAISSALAAVCGVIAFIAFLALRGGLGGRDS